jgi:phosphoribosylglycinamide formyltransferase-1
MSASRVPVAIVISGGGSNMAALLAAMTAPDHPAACVLVAANRPDAGGLDKARAAGAPTALVDHRAFSEREAFERALAARIEAAGADLVCLAGFMRLLTPWFIDRFHNRLLNIHPALLPSFRGLRTHERALRAGVAIHGATVHLARQEMDEGPILGQAAVRVRPGDDAERLAARVLRMEHRLYPAALAAFASGALRIEGDAVRGRRIALFDDAPDEDADGSLV